MLELLKSSPFPEMLFAASVAGRARNLALRRNVLDVKEAGTKFLYMSNFDLYKSRTADWRDNTFCAMAPDPVDPDQELTDAIRDELVEYSEQVIKLAVVLLEFLSEVLALEPISRLHPCPVGANVLMQQSQSQGYKTYSQTNIKYLH